MHLDALADGLQQRDGQLATEVFSKFSQAGEHHQVPVRVRVQQLGREQVEAQLLQQHEHALGARGVEEANLFRVKHVQRDADGDGLAVPKLVFRELLQLVRRPVAEIQRARAAELEGIAAGGNVVQVQFGATVDEPLHRRWLERGQRLGVALDGVEELRVTDARDLHGLDVAGALVARG